MIWSYPIVYDYLIPALMGYYIIGKHRQKLRLEGEVDQLMCQSSYPREHIPENWEPPFFT